MNIQIFEESDLVDRRSSAIYEEVYVSSIRDPLTEGIRMASGWSARKRKDCSSISEHYFPR